nr:MAG TPA: hypothetical protein [Caudoviricetes sp.]
MDMIIKIISLGVSIAALIISITALKRSKK